MTFRFLALPLELRNNIYSFLLHPTDDEAQPLYDDRAERLCRHPRAEKHPAILRTCKQIYDEAANVLYDSSTFYELYLSGPVQAPMGSKARWSQVPLFTSPPTARNLKEELVRPKVSNPGVPKPGSGSGLTMEELYHYSLGVIDPMVFPRLRCIRIYTARAVFWQWRDSKVKSACAHVSAVRKLLIEILILLSQDEEISGRHQKVLEIVCFSGVDDVLKLGQKDALCWWADLGLERPGKGPIKASDIADLLRAVQSMRELKLMEVIMGSSTRCELSIDMFLGPESGWEPQGLELSPGEDALECLQNMMFDEISALTR